MKFPGEPNGDKNNFKWVFTNGNSLEKKIFQINNCN
jgi:hypothetical protein